MVMSMDAAVTPAGDAVMLATATLVMLGITVTSPSRCRYVNWSASFAQALR